MENITINENYVNISYTSNITCNDTKVFDYITQKCLDHAPILTQEKIIRASILIFMAFVSLIGNIVTVCSIHSRHLTRPTLRQNASALYRLVMHLSISDILVTLFCLVGDAVWLLTVEWIFGDFSCRIFKVMQMFSLYLSTFILVLIGIDRWIAVKYPMKTLNTSNRYKSLLIGSYGLAFILSLPQVSDLVGLNLNLCINDSFFPFSVFYI